MEMASPTGARRRSARRMHTLFLCLGAVAIPLNFANMGVDRKGAAADCGACSFLLPSRLRLGMGRLPASCLSAAESTRLVHACDVLGGRGSPLAHWTGPRGLLGGRGGEERAAATACSATPSARRREKAFRAASKGGELVASRFKELSDLFNKAAARGKLAEARILYPKVLEVCPTDRRRQMVFTMLKAFAKAGKHGQALAWLKGCGFPPTRESVGKVMNSAVKSGNVTAAEEAFDWACEVLPTQKYDLPMWGMLVDAYARRKSWVKVEEAIQRMKDEGVRPDLVFYNVLMMRYGKAKKHEKVLELLESMTHAEIKPDFRTKRSALFSLKQSGKGDVSKRLLAAIREAGIEVKMPATAGVKKSYQGGSSLA